MDAYRESSQDHYGRKAIQGVTVELKNLHSLTRGTDTTLSLTFYSGGVPLSLTAASTSVVFTMRPSWNDAASLTKTGLTGTSGGVVAVAIAPADTASLAPGMYRWAVQYTVGGLVKEAGRGLILLGADIV
jgi:hypothetical protein